MLALSELEAERKYQSWCIYQLALSSNAPVDWEALLDEELWAFYDKGLATPDEVVRLYWDLQVN